MRRFLLVVSAISLLTSLASAEVINLYLDDQNVAPGASVIAQRILLDIQQLVYQKPKQITFNYGWPDNITPLDSWVSPYDENCASTNSKTSVLRVLAPVTVPTNAVVKGIVVKVRAAATCEGLMYVWLAAGSGLYLYGYRFDLPKGDCSRVETLEAGAPDFTWFYDWDSSKLQNLSIGISAYLDKNADEDLGTLYIDSIVVEVYYYTPIKLQKITVYNTELPGTAIEGKDIEKIEIVRASDGKVIGTQTNASELAKLTTGGVTIDITSSYQTFKDLPAEVDVRIKLKSTAPLDRALMLGWTICTIDGNRWWVWYENPPARILVGPAPICKFEEMDNVDVYAGQRFLAGQIVVNGNETPFDVTLAELMLKNGAAWPLLDGRYIASIEVRRASDNALLGQQTSGTELAKFSTSDGTKISLTSNNTVPAYGQVVLEIWITLKSDAPAGQRIQLQGGQILKISGTYVYVGGDGPTCTVKTKEPGEVWLEVDNDEEVKDGGAVPGQKFLAQRLILEDDDSDPYDVSVTSILIKNVADNPLAEQHISLIELRRTDTNTTVGSTTSISGLNTTGVRIPLSMTVEDDNTVKLEIWVTLKETAPLTRKLRLSSLVWYKEGGVSEPSPSGAVDGPEFEIVTGDGLDIEDQTSAATQTVYPGQTFLAQILKLTDDNDKDPCDVEVTKVIVANVSGSPKVQDGDVAGIEVRDPKGKVLGRATTISNLTTTGVEISLTANVIVKDDDSLTIEIWVTLKSTVQEGRKFVSGAKVQHTECGATFTKPDDFRTSKATFTVGKGQGRTVNFTYTPEKPKWNDEIEFKPSVSPETGIVYARWDFGDGTVVELKTAEGDKPLAPIKHTYGKGGEFTVTYAVRDATNLETSTSKKITVTNEPPKNVDFTFSPSSPIVNQTVTFTPSDKIEDPDGDIKKATFRWDFGDGSAAVTTTGPQNVTHTYTQAGTYTVTLTVTDQGGAASTARKEISIGGVTPPAPQVPTVTNVTVSPANPTAGETVTFTATATAPTEDPVTQWEWDFGDNTSSTTETNTATHTYTNPGQYTVRVRAKNNAGWSQPLTRQITVFPPGVTFGFLVLDNPVTGNQCRIQIFAPAGATDLKITILDQAGRPVILNKSVSVGTFTWDLKDQNGRIVPNGLYLFYITAKIEGQEKRTEIGRILVRR